MEAWQFFYDIMETMAKERLNNPQVFIEYLYHYFYIEQFVKKAISYKKYHDFPEMTRELITAYTKEVNGKKVPMWDGEEIDELVTAQVFISFKAIVLPQVLSFFLLESTFFHRLFCSWWLATPQLHMR